MKLATSFTIAVLLLLTVTAQDDRFVYADFEKAENGRPISNNGGLVQIYTAQESTPVKFKGLANASPGAPERIVLKDAPNNHLASFEYNLLGPNDWANVTLEVAGRPMNDGKPVADDVSGYKQLSLQLYATGVDSLRVEFISHGPADLFPSGRDCDNIGLWVGF